MPEMHPVSSPASPREPNTPSLAVNRHPCEIRFQNLSFHVPHKGDGGLPILNGVTGMCRASKMVAVMGPSGAGKSTLVCLARVLGLNDIAINQGYSREECFDVCCLHTEMAYFALGIDDCQRKALPRELPIVYSAMGYLQNTMHIDALQQPAPSIEPFAAPC